ncbi:hypothetical protein GNI_178650 [Gregarina niphandrodes]|uniref:Uncharacterized protein n=1 Tax=Gregarina niphandrodes TaxID=110365 RepID=A0A023AX08_GRENI|nr:hypothetical protein GNI_178650 [Gregarina niphandrodes]EZG43276.1 hypothetical protein GNI_178650 [Gregarina niphandrodes]|eukprot:XP_011133470.1 hypothetical protein GNI_178650 [Gregarina niphandrodes]
MYNVCRTSDSCVVTDTKTKTNTTLTTGKTTKTNTTLTTGKTTKSKIRKLTIGNMKNIRWCADELDQEEALCVAGVGLCVLDTDEPEKRCYQRGSWPEVANIRKYVSKFISPGNKVDACRVRGGCPILPCVRETNLKHTHCVKGVPYCLTSKSDPEKRCFLMGTQLKFRDISWFRGQSKSPFKVCRASGKCRTKRPMVCDVPWPRVLSRAEVPVEDCVGTGSTYSSEPVDFPESCALPGGGAFVCHYWDAIANKNQRMCFRYGGDIGESFTDVQNALQTLRPELLYCNLNHAC